MKSRSAALNGIVKSRPFQYCIDSARGMCCVHTPARFLLGQAARSGPSSYRLRESGHTIFVRHGTPDVDVLIEIFSAGIYDFPDEVGNALRSAPAPLRVLDLGANIGLFGVFILGQFADAKVLSVEPDPSNFALLSRCVETNELGTCWRTSQGCVSDTSGETSFAAGGFDSSHVTTADGPNTLTVPQIDFFDLVEGVNVVKLDVEGSEWPILLDRRFGTLGVDVIALEWHKGEEAPSDPKGEALSILTGAGYRTRAQPSYSPKCGQIWAWRDPVS